MYLLIPYPKKNLFINSILFYSYWKSAGEEKLRASIQLVIEFQKIIAFLINSNRKYVDPKNLLSAIVNDNGVPLEIGDQKDVGEFNINFLARIEDAMVPQAKLNESSMMGNLSSSIRQDSSNRLGPSPLKRTESFISRSFFGNLLIITRANENAENDNRLIEIKEETTFGQIMINATDPDIYQGWESNYNSEIENFVTPLGTKTNAHQQCWITQPPSVLFLQIQRVVYNKEQKKLEKITNPIKFDKTIYIDRFLETNREKTSEIRQKVKLLKKELKEKEKLLNELSSFGNNNLDLTTILQLAAEFLKLQSTEPTASIQNSQKSPFDFGPDTTGKITKPRIEDSKDLLLEYAAKTTDGIEKLKSEIDIINAKIKDSYKEMNENPYILHSIWAHSGSPESGHYYAYIYDFVQDNWKRYSDTEIVNEDESVIFPNPKLKPEFNNLLSQVQANAYCLIYVEEKLAKMSKAAKFKTVSEAYLPIVPPPLIEEVRKDNQKFDSEVLEYKAKQRGLKICRDYNEHIGTIISVSKMLGYESVNFITYLFSQRNEFYKWCLLDSSVRDNTEEIGLDLIPPTDPLLINLLQLLSTSKAPMNSIILSPGEQTLLNALKEQYKKVLLDWLTQRYILENLTLQNWMKGIHALSFYVTQAKYTNSANHDRMSEVIKLLVLRLYSYINERLTKKDFKTALQFVDIIGQLCICYIPKGDSHTKMILKILPPVFSNIKQILSPEQYKYVESIIEKIKIFPLSYKSNIMKTCPPVFY